MVYDPHRIFLQVIQRLAVRPFTSLTQLADDLGIERHTIAKAVKSTTGLTFRDFRKIELLKHARSFLKHESNRTIKEVAFMLGYRSQGSLSRFVRTAAGCSAKQLKMEHQSKQQSGLANEGKHVAGEQLILPLLLNQ